MIKTKISVSKRYSDVKRVQSRIVLGFRLKKERSGTGGGLNLLSELCDTVPVPTGDWSEKADKLQ